MRADAMRASDVGGDCKAWAHKWDRVPMPPYLRRVTMIGAVRTYWRCDECGSEKLVNINLATGKAFSTKYYHVDGYKEEIGKGMSKAEHRLQYIRRNRLVKARSSKKTR
jgi:hypothetical protein